MVIKENITRGMELGVDDDGVLLASGIRRI